MISFVYLFVYRKAPTLILAVNLVYAVGLRKKDGQEKVKA